MFINVWSFFHWNPPLNLRHFENFILVILFFIETHHWTLDILKFLFWLSLTTSLYVFPIHIETSSSSCGFTTTKSLMLRSIIRVYVYLEKALSSWAHNKEQWLDLLHHNFHDDWLQGLNHSWTSNCLIDKSLPKEWNFDEVKFWQM